jgi:hypothetical protein
MPLLEPTPFRPPVAVGGGPAGPGGPTPGVFNAPTLPASGPTPFVPPVLPGGGPSDPPVPVSEPTTMFLLASGLLGLWGLRKKFKK